MIKTCLPLNNNAGPPIDDIVGRTVVALTMLATEVSMESCVGFWKNAEDKLFNEPVLLVTLEGNLEELAIRDALLCFKAQAEQEAVIMASSGAIEHCGAIADLLEKHGGCTVTSRGVAFAWEGAEFL